MTVTCDTGTGDDWSCHPSLIGYRLLYTDLVQQAVCKCNPATYPISSFFVSPLLFGNRRCRLPFQTQGFSVSAQSHQQQPHCPQALFLQRCTASHCFISRGSSSPMHFTQIKTGGERRPACDHDNWGKGKHELLLPCARSMKHEKRGGREGL